MIIMVDIANRYLHGILLLLLLIARLLPLPVNGFVVVGGDVAPAMIAWQDRRDGTSTNRKSVKN